MANIDFNLKCWYKDGCNMADYNCEKTCHRYLEMNYLINNCGMKNAERFLKLLQPDERDIDAFLRLNDIKTNVVNFVQTQKYGILGLSNIAYSYKDAMMVEGKGIDDCIVKSISLFSKLP